MQHDARLSYLDVEKLRSCMPLKFRGKNKPKKKAIRKNKKQVFKEM